MIKQMEQNVNRRICIKGAWLPFRAILILVTILYIEIERNF